VQPPRERRSRHASKPEEGERNLSNNKARKGAGPEGRGHKEGGAEASVTLGTRGGV
jgi:hypothetical protein